MTATTQFAYINIHLYTNHNVQARIHLAILQNPHFLDVVFLPTCSIGCQSSAELLMYTMPFLDTVAGEALSTLCGSKMTLQLGAIGMRSPFARVKVLLSSSTELRFSIQMASTGPSSTSQICSPGQKYSKVR